MPRQPPHDERSIEQGDRGELWGELFAQLGQSQALGNRALNPQQAPLHGLFATAEGIRYGQVLLAGIEGGLAAENGIGVLPVEQRGAADVYQVAPCRAVAVNIDVRAIAGDHCEVRWAWRGLEAPH
ncbi:MAG: hypothetical protein E3J81_03480 [Dehalococcoidia bacterium]|nr:MAG: hypothetical protein E3J81_03480 [Dehalococcoidia bacterium]